MHADAVGARHGFDEVTFEEDLDEVGMTPHVVLVADESRRDGVRMVSDANGAPFADDGLIGREAGNGRRWQRAKLQFLFGEPCSSGLIELSVDEALHERDVVGDGGEVF